MKTLPRVAALLTIGTALALPVWAQWAAYPTRNVPRTPTGEPNLTAPAPRTADGKPDLNGIWANGRGGGGGGGGQARGGGAGGGQARGGGGQAQGGQNAPRGGNAPAPAPAPDAIPVATFGNVGSGLPGGSAPMQPWAADLVK